MTVVGRRLQTIDEGDKDELLLSQDESSKIQNYSSSSDTSSATARKYTTWEREESDAVRTYFTDYYNGVAVKKLPGKQDIAEFLQEHPTFSKGWKTIHTKTMNVRLQQKRASNREKGWVSGSKFKM